MKLNIKTVGIEIPYSLELAKVLVAKLQLKKSICPSDTSMGKSYFLIPKRRRPLPPLSLKLQSALNLRCSFHIYLALPKNKQ